MVIFKRVSAYIIRCYMLLIKRDPYTLTVHRWFKDKGDSTLRLDYPLTEDSVVFDIGGYKGEWAQKIAERYNPYICIFEPVPKFYSLIIEKFKKNPKVSIFNFGLFDKNRVEKLSINHDSSSIYRSSENIIEILLVDIFEFLNKTGIEKIDLMKINIEAAEYPLLRRMIDKKIVERCHDIQIQFHTFYPNAIQLRDEIREALRETHFITYDYPFVWENWRKK